MTYMENREADPAARQPGTAPLGSENGVYHRPEAARQTKGLISELVSEATSLFRDEAKLAQREMSEKIDQVISGAISLAVGAVLVIPALFILLEAIVAALVNAEGPGWEPWVAALTVGGITALIALGLMWAGSRAMKVQSLTPDRTIRQVEKDARTIRAKV